MLRLVGEGVLALDAPEPRGGYSLRQLLQHTAGVPDYGGSADYHAAVAAGEAPWSAADLRRRVGETPLFSPGEGWAYSNIGYLILRERIEAATGLTLAGALSGLVFRPLGIDAVVVETLEQAAGLPGVIAGYHPGWVYHGLAAGSVAEAARLLDGLFAGRLLPPDLLAEMTTPRLLDVPLGARPWTQPGYGLGLIVAAGEGRVMAGHTGGGPSSSIAVYGVEGRVAAAFGLGEDPTAVERAVVSALA